MKSYEELAFDISVAKVWQQELISVVVQNVKELRPFIALASCDHDCGTNCERIRKRCLQVMFKFGIGVNLFQRLFEHLVISRQA